MKRMSSSDSLIRICPTGEEKGMYGRGFQRMIDGMDEEECAEEELCPGAGGGQGCGEKKRRLSVDQVRALEKNFEVENKLEPERKVKLAQELGLQPRQVAVWFQNHRSRWKTKQLERDYASLKASYEALRVDVDALHRDKEDLLAEVNIKNMTLGAILQRDAFLRQLAHLRSTMEAASFRIENVEWDLAGIRERLTWSEEKKADRETVRSASLRIFRHEGEEVGPAEAVGPSSKSCMIGFGNRLRNGLKSLFRRRGGESGGAEQRQQRGGGGGEARGLIFFFKKKQLLPTL